MDSPELTALVDAIQICDGIRSKYAWTLPPYADKKLRRIAERIEEQIERARQRYDDGSLRFLPE